MEIISIEKKTFEELVSRLGQFVKRMDSINRTYYRPEDVERLIANDV